MKSVGEAMSIGRTFKQSFQKALRSLETGRAGFGADGKDGPLRGAGLTPELAAQLTRPNAERLFAIRAAFRRGWSVERGARPDPDRPVVPARTWRNWRPTRTRSPAPARWTGWQATAPLFRQAKEFGYSDRQIACLLRRDRGRRCARRAKPPGIMPVYGLVDTCAAEFEAFTPYFYSTYGDAGRDAAAGSATARRS